MEVLNGKLLSDKLKEQIKIKLQNLNGKIPTLAVVLVGDDPASAIYVNNKAKACEKVGMGSVVIKMPSDSTQQEVINKIEELNNDVNINGILVQLPLPKGLDENLIIQKIDPNKDVDALTYINKGKLLSGKNIIAPCTPSGIVDLLKEYNIPISGKNVVIIGRSQLVGMPLFLLLTKENATVTLCHSKTENLKEIAKRADILIVAIGKPKFITAEFVKKDATVIDVGINRVDGKVVGDCDYESVASVAGHLTPVPGGVGPMTIAELLNNTLRLSGF